jgi:hypothetical protein
MVHAAWWHRPNAVGQTLASLDHVVGASGVRRSFVL